MKSITELTDEYIGHSYEAEEGHTITCMRTAFKDGAIAERKELTKWHPSTEFPELDKQVLVRYKWPEDSKFVYTIGYACQEEAFKNQIVWYTDDDVFVYDLDFVWRYIHEDETV